jgi:DNA-directed RNA polymerase subunit RPC12/RpoP
MAAEPIKFRCFRCQKLLGVSRSKAGAVVACPNCGAELIVPGPAGEGETTGRVAPKPPVGLDVLTAPDFPDFAGGDVGRNDPILTGNWPKSPGTVEIPSPFPVAPVETPTEPFFPAIETGETSLRPDPPRRYRPLPPGLIENASVVSPASDTHAAFLRVPELGFPAVSVETPAPPMSGMSTVTTVEAIPLEALAESPAPILERSLAPRRDDVVLPRSVVSLWSFFVVLALVAAFAAGLLAGHYVWAPRAAAKP